MVEFSPSAYMTDTPLSRLKRIPIEQEHDIQIGGAHYGDSLMQVLQQHLARRVGFFAQRPSCHAGHERGWAKPPSVGACYGWSGKSREAKYYGPTQEP